MMILSTKLVQSRFTRVLTGLGLAALVTLTGCAQQRQTIRVRSLTQSPMLNKEIQKEDFAFPSRPPQLLKGKTVFAQNCATCHTGASLSYNKIRAMRPIDMYLMLTSGNPKYPNHPTYKTLDRQARWESIFYYRYVSGEGQFSYDKELVKSVFGANCAVCHGNRGYADGPLYTGHATRHEMGMADVKNQFYPPPANFHVYSRMYNRTNDQIVKYLNEGIYPSAMPSWYGKVDKAKGVKFDEVLITDLMKYVRSFSYDDTDLPDDEIAKATGKPQPKPLQPAKMNTSAPDAKAGGGK